MTKSTCKAKSWLSTTGRSDARLVGKAAATRLWQLSGKLARVALREASGHDDAPRFAILLVASSLKDGRDGLLLCLTRAG